MGEKKRNRRFRQEEEAPGREAGPGRKRRLLMDRLRGKEKAPEDEE